MLLAPSSSLSVCSEQGVGVRAPSGQNEPAGQGPAQDTSGHVERESGAAPDGVGLSEPDKQKNPASQMADISPSLINRMQI